jgi:hypothetical protein
MSSVGNKSTSSISDVVLKLRVIGQCIYENEKGVK